MIISGSNTITLKNISVGEVGLCSGQSNMEYTMKLSRGFAKPAPGIDSTVEDMQNLTRSWQRRKNNFSATFVSFFAALREEFGLNIYFLP